MEQEQKKSLLIIKANPTGLLPAEGFLRNRDWKVKATNNLKEALVYLVQEQPAFVMISVDHPNKKVRNLPKVLVQAFPVCVIAFAEESSTASYKNLSASATEYLIYPPITGPAIERTVNKYYKDQQTRGTSSNAPRALADGETEGGVISIKGNSGFSAENAKNILAQMLGADGETAVAGLGDSSSASFMQGGSTPADPNAMAANSLTPAYRPTEQAPGATPGQSPGYVPQTNSAGAGGFGTVVPPSQTAGAQGALSGVGTQSDPSMAGHGIGAGQRRSAYQENENGTPLSPHHQRSQKNNGPSWAPIEQKKDSSKKQRPGPETDDGDNALTEKDSLISRGTKEALDRSCIQLATAKPSEIDLTSNMACLVVESSRFSGYLITAMGKNRMIDESFLTKVKTRLQNFLKEHGEKMNAGESLNLKLEQVPFMPWAMEQAEFLKKSTHLGEEVAMAFFPREEIHAKFGDSPDEEMAAVQISEFEGDMLVNFNLYVHLPKNNKYVLYTPRGSVFYDTQKNRLTNSGVSHLHILKAEMKDLNTYRAENYLNDTINSFNNRERPPKKMA